MSGFEEPHWLAVEHSEGASVAGADRGYTSGAFALQIDGKPAGNLSSVEGGEVYGVVALEQIGSDSVVRKHIGDVKYEDITITCGIPSTPLTDWLRDFLKQPGEARNGSIVFLDYNHSPVRELQWTNSLISSVTFPSLDAASKGGALLTVTITPEYTRMVTPAQSKATISSTPVKKWLAANFRVTIPGMTTNKASAVEALTVSRPHLVDDVGVSRMAVAEQGALEVGDLILTLSQSGSADFTAWVEDFVVKGLNGKDHEKQATVTYLAPALNSTLMEVELSGVGIYRLRPDKIVGGAETIARVTASMYCEEISIPPIPTPPPTTTSTGSTSSTSTGSASTTSTDVSVLAAALRQLIVDAPMRIADPAAIARRLVATVAPESDPADSRRREGEVIGSAWARDQASLPELEELGASARREWTSIYLVEGHSLVVALQTAGVVPAEHVGPLDLERDSFVEGLVDGANDTLGTVRGHLSRHMG
jgi:phage tail-like protein